MNYSSTFFMIFSKAEVRCSEITVENQTKKKTSKIFKHVFAFFI
jgi:hypothetical protein